MYKKIYATKRNIEMPINKGETADFHVALRCTGFIW